MMYFFEWDKQKNKENLKKHGIDFKTAGSIINSKNVVRWQCKPDKWDPEYNNYEHNFSISDERIKEIIKKGRLGDKARSLTDEDVEYIFSTITQQDRIRDHWVGKYEEKYFSIFTVFRLPKTRIISARRARPNEIKAYLAIKEKV